MQYISWEQMEQAFQAGDMARAEKYSRSVGPALGASGAVMGIFAAFAYLFPNTRLFIMFIPFPIKAKWAVIGLAAIDLFGGVTNVGSNIAHFAHLGGALTGFILVLIWNKTDRRRFY
jgi:rhomboid-like protein